MAKRSKKKFKFKRKSLSKSKKNLDKKELIIETKSDWIKKGAIVIDAGYHPEKCGDIDLDNIEKIASAYTPVPGGVGPMTINTLILQTLQSAERAASN